VFKAYTSAAAGLGATGSQSGVSPAGIGAGPGGWHPDSLYMLGLVIAEIVAVGFLTRHLMRG
jgi:hypothetical protein